MNLDNVRKHFEEEAFEYNGLIPRIIPKYHEQNETILAMIPFDRTRTVKALDLGCGTGILSYQLLSVFPKAKVAAFEMSCLS